MICRVKAGKNVPTRRLVLREVVAADLPLFFEQQLDATATHMAAFTAGDPADRVAFEKHWNRILSDPSVFIRTIVLLRRTAPDSSYLDFTEAAPRVAGHIAIYGPSNERDVTYWLGRAYWGRGVATRALAMLLNVAERPLHARAAGDNVASIRVLQKCGFGIYGRGQGFANGRGAAIEEVLLALWA